MKNTTKNKTKKRIQVLFFFGLLLGFYPSHAKNGILQGIVYDSQTRETLPFATVTISNTSKGTTTDLDGRYVLDLSPGVYTVVVSFTSYKPQYLNNVIIEENKATQIDVLMEEAVSQLQEVVVTAKRITNTNIAVLNSVKSAGNVVNGMSSEIISKSQVKDASEAVSKIPGISITSGSFINVRGLNPRYNNTFLNNAASPSTESDSKAFALDAIPGYSIDNIMVYKTCSPELPADFSGGFVQISTKNMPTESGLAFSYGLGTYTKTLGKTLYSGKSYAADFLGFGAGIRNLPNSLPSNIAAYSTSEKAGFARALNNDWGVRERKALPKQNIGIDWSGKYKAGGLQIGGIASFRYGNNDKVLNNVVNNRFGIYDRVKQKSTYQNKYLDDIYSNESKLNALANLALIFPGGLKIDFKNLFMQSGISRMSFREGINYNNNYTLKEQEYYYAQKSIYSTQIGIQQEISKKHALSFDASYSMAQRSEPDRRNIVFRLQDQEDLPHYGEYRTGDLKRFYQELNENLVSGQLNYLFKPVFGHFRPKVKAGLYTEWKQRDFQGRNFIYNAGRPSHLPIDFMYRSPEEIFQNQYLTENGLYLDENTRKSDAYSAYGSINAAYIGFDLAFYGFRLHTGLRTEWSIVSLDSYESDGSRPVNVFRNTIQAFPSANLSYTLKEKHILRIAYGASVNRPELREIAPYVYYDFNHFADFTGNPDLQDAMIQNIDMRYEFYPSNGETFSLGGFFKHFKNPIEMTYIPVGGGNAMYTYKNAEKARCFGLELELMKNLDFIGLKDFKLLLNASYMNSFMVFQKDRFEIDRPMQGQSPYTVNVGLYYSNEKHQWDASLLFNSFGKRIYAVGEVNQNALENIPDVYELPFHSLDLSVSKKLGKSWELKFGVKNLLDMKSVLRQFIEYEVDGVKHQDSQEVKNSASGMEINLSITYKL